MTSGSESFDAVLFDFGGVILTSPFDAFAEYERANGLPDGLLRSINATDPDTNAWARFERGDVDLDGFCAAFEAEAAARGHDVDGRTVLSLIEGRLRPEMVEALRRVGAAGYTTACLTNNFRSNERADVAEVMTMFDHVVESSTAGCRKPEPRFYEIALEHVGAPAERCVFLDDLGINLKPARAMGMTTIKVLSAEQALADLTDVLGIDLG